MIKPVDAILERLKKHTREYAVVSNPSYVYPPEEYYPLAPPLHQVEQLSGVLMDMDGTTTTTEELCIYSLDEMVRLMSGVGSREQWQGLDRENDYPYIIGNSTTKHVEYLIHTYQSYINEDAARQAFLMAAVWTLQEGRDEQRRMEVRQNLTRLGLSEIIQPIEQHEMDGDDAQSHAARISGLDFTRLVSLGIDIYYQVYHQMLARLNEGESGKIKKTLFGSQNSEKDLIAPMPGIPLFLPMLKGWLGADISYVAGDLVDHYQASRRRELSQDQKEEVIRRLTRLSRYFEQHPVQVGLVTSSIRYEADVVIQEVFRVIREYFMSSSLPDQRKRFLAERFGDYRNYYDAFVTASDSSEIRLKPHRDLYSIALHQLGIPPENFDQVIGFEDSQSGTIAIRAAGIGCCVAVPFAETSDHNFEAAVHTVKGGIPETLLKHQLFIKQEEKQRSDYE
jgi:beta-phosphoglucomutase-like phosphatase (HAD superfamily)